jgi:hypothetical protein
VSTTNRLSGATEFVDPVDNNRLPDAFDATRDVLVVQRDERSAWGRINGDKGLFSNQEVRDVVARFHG